ncbi:hypothetical protein [Paraliomyxa miuraensis]|uniref:hypothetical protein n=1 Tax=Paraliomyxa miuraensis TaxID=376150 RepID=UPI00225023DB|nr:hypothetical protein [Paraliomyxa miuraensis]MCX4246852.1 hypothetical protein [Paraliomyxa miuraensis]
MSWSAPRLASLFVGPLLVSACAAGSDDGLTGFSSAAYSASNGDAGTSSGGGSEDTNESAEGPLPTASADGTTSGGSNSGGDGGNALCCMPGGQAGCDSEVTEACVCTSQPSCCQNVWSQECVDLAIACGDPFCTGDSGDTTTGGGVDLECDPDFSFVPEPVAGAMFNVAFTDPVGLTWVKMNAEGPGGVVIGGTNEVIRGNPGAFSWSYDYNGLGAGLWTFVFTSKDTENGPDIVRGTCEKQL